MMKKHIPFFILIILIGLVISSRVLIAGDRSFLSFFDSSVQFYAWYTYASKAFAQGTIPLWDFNQLSGHSFIGEMQPGVFYPWNLLLFFILSRLSSNQYHDLAPRIIESFLVIKLITCAFFSYWMYLELKLNRFSAVIGAMVFTYAGFTFDRMSQQICVFDSITWIPFIVAAYIKSLNQNSFIKRIFWLHTTGLGLGMAILAGHYLGFIYGLAIIAFYTVYCIFRTIYLKASKNNKQQQINFKELVYIVGLLGITALIGLLFASVQLLPTLEYTKLSVRFVNAPNPVNPGEKIPYQFLGDQFHLTSAGLLSIINPNFEIFNMRIGVDGFLYSGVLPLVLGTLVFFKYRRKEDENVNFFIILLLFSFIYMLGGDSIFHAAYNLFSPISDPVRTSSRITFLTHFAMSSLAAYGVQYITILQESFLINKIFKKNIKLLCLITILLPLLFLFFAPDKFTILNSLIMTLLLLITTEYIIICWTRTTLSRNSWQKWILIISFSLILAQDTYYFIIVNRLSQPLYNPPSLLYPPEVVKKYSAQLLSLQEANTYYRIANFETPELKNFGNVLDIKMTMSHGASLPKSYFTFLADLGWITQHLYDLLSAKYILASNKNDKTKILVKENSTALPIFRLYYNYIKIADTKTARNKLNDAQFDYKNIVILDEDPKPQLADVSNTNTSNNKASLLEESPNEVKLSVKSNSQGILVFADQMYPGWKAYVNNKQVKIFTADTIFKAIIIPKGNSEVIFKYQPLSYTIGLTITFFMIFTYIALLSYIHLTQKSIF